MAVARKTDISEFNTPELGSNMPPAKQPKRELRRVTNTDDFFALCEGWQQLEQQAHNDFSFFQTFDWCHKWWQNIGIGAEDELAIFVLMEGHKALAIWPMQFSHLSLGAKALVPLTYPHTEYANMLTDHSLADEECAQFIKDCLAEADCDLIILPKIPTGTVLEKATSGMGVTAPVDEIASVFDLQAFKSKDDYLASLSSSKRKYRNKRRNKLAKLGALDYQIIYAGEEGYADLVADPQIAHNGTFVEYDHPTDGRVKTPGFPIRFSRSPSSIRYGAPLAGEHTDDILTDLGFSGDEIAALAQAGVVGRQGA